MEQNFLFPNIGQILQFIAAVNVLEKIGLPFCMESMFQILLGKNLIILKEFLSIACIVAKNLIFPHPDLELKNFAKRNVMWIGKKMMVLKIILKKMELIFIEI